MNPKPEFNLLAEVKRYIETATPDEIHRDMVAAEFSAFAGVGDVVEAAAKKYTSGIVFTSAGLRALVAQRYTVAAVGTMPLASSVAGNTEEMPLAA